MRSIMFNEKGQGLLQVLIAGGLLSLISLGVMRVMATAMKGRAQIKSLTSQDMLRTSLLSGIDCAGTMASAGVDPASPGSSCTSTSAQGGQTGPYLRLRRRSPSGSVVYFGTPLDADGATTVGGKRIRVSCSESEQTLVVRAIDTTETDWDRGNALIVGTGPNALPACFSAPTSAPSFSGTADVTFTNGSPHSTQNTVNVPIPCPNPVVTTQSYAGSILCGNGSGPTTCPSYPSSSSQDLKSYVAGVTSSSFEVFLSGADGVWVGAVSPAFKIAYQVSCP